MTLIFINNNQVELRPQVLFNKVGLRSVIFTAYILSVDQQCQNLTVDDAPLNGGLVCHWYVEVNSQQCAVKCNNGYEFPSRINNYETCGPTTGYEWSFRNTDPGAIIEPCIGKPFSVKYMYRCMHSLQYRSLLLGCHGHK